MCGNEIRFLFARSPATQNREPGIIKHPSLFKNKSKKHLSGGWGEGFG